MTKVCPQRIIKQAIELLEQYSDTTQDELTAYELSQNIEELDGLERALYRDGIINIEEWKG